MRRTTSLHLQSLESRAVPSSSQLFAMSQDGSSIVSVYAINGPLGGNPSLDGSGRFLTTIDAYPGTAGGVRVAVGDVTGDGIEDVVTVPGPTQLVAVKVFDGGALLNGQVNLVRNFMAFEGRHSGGAYVAVGQVDTTNFSKEIIVGAGEGGGPRLQVFNSAGTATIRDFFAYDINFRGGVRVATADFNGDSRADIITAAGPGGGPHVRIFDGAQNGGAPIDEFFAYSAAFLGGVYVAAGELDGNVATPEIATGAGEGGGPHLRVWGVQNGRNQLKYEKFVGNPLSRAGVRVGIANLDNRTDRASLYTGTGSGSLNNTVDNSGNGEPRLRSYRLDAVTSTGALLPGFYPVVFSSSTARNDLYLERVGVFDAFQSGRAGGLYINV